MIRILLFFLCTGLSLTAYTQVQFTQKGDALKIRMNERPFATYVFKDENIPRPYFHSVKTPNGFQITRNHPPVEGQDPTDHATYHPGIWMAFGDISGHDFWRNKAQTQHVKFLDSPHTSDSSGQFSVLNHYLADNEIVCEERCTIQIIPKEQGTLMLWNSKFSSEEHDFYFGDQEEMGLGVRVASPIMVENGGTIFNSHGNRNEDGVWGKQAKWCAYYANLSENQAAGVLLMPSPENFRQSWFHARDYGLLTANPFGRKAFTSQEASQVEVKRGETFELNFGIFVFQTNHVTENMFQEIYSNFLKALEEL